MTITEALGILSLMTAGQDMICLSCEVDGNLSLCDSSNPSCSDNGSRVVFTVRCGNSEVPEPSSLACVDVLSDGEAKKVEDTLITVDETQLLAPWVHPDLQMLVRNRALPQISGNGQIVVYLADVESQPGDRRGYLGFKFDASSLEGACISVCPEGRLLRTTEVAIGGGGDAAFVSTGVYEDPSPFSGTSMGAGRIYLVADGGARFLEPCGFACWSISVSDDGEQLAFVSSERLSESDSDTLPDAYCLNLTDLSLRHLSRDKNGKITCASLSPDGGYLAWETVRDGEHAQIYSVKLDKEVTKPLLRSSIAGIAGNAASFRPRCANSGACAFLSHASNLLPSDIEEHLDIYISAKNLGLSSPSGGKGGPGHCGPPAVSADGRVACFGSTKALLADCDERAKGPYAHIYWYRAAPDTTSNPDRRGE